MLTRADTNMRAHTHRFLQPHSGKTGCLLPLDTRPPLSACPQASPHQSGTTPASESQGTRGRAHMSGVEREGASADPERLGGRHSPQVRRGALCTAGPGPSLLCRPCEVGGSNPVPGARPSQSKALGSQPQQGPSLLCGPGSVHPCTGWGWGSRVGGEEGGGIGLLEQLGRRGGEHAANGTLVGRLRAPRSRPGRGRGL